MCQEFASLSTREVHEVYQDEAFQTLRYSAGFQLPFTQAYAKWAAQICIQSHLPEAKVREWLRKLYSGKIHSVLLVLGQYSQ